MTKKPKKISTRSFTQRLAPADAANRRTLTLRIPDKMHKRIVRAATAESMTINTFVTLVLEAHLDAL